ncbi:hypothetical protein ACVWW6_005995 [Bradyrhizobium sp. USDA 3311]
MTASNQSSSADTAKLPPAREIQTLIEDLTTPDWDTKKAFASHRRAWIVQCLRTVLSQINAAPAATTELTCEFAQMLPGGKLDDSTYEKIETALDNADAPCTKDGKWLSLHERIAALTSTEPQTVGIIERLCKPETGGTIVDVLADYRAIRRDALALSRGQKEGER